ncbi:MAG: hypothetical protein K2M16_05165 [Muribaculaceae bacterium]|nr:hypothetical protein [Muribaculaceae bacterium]
MVTSMLEKAIEIEGLLRIIRDGKPLPETYILLNIKATQLAEQCSDLKETAEVLEPAPIQALTDFVMTSAEIPEEKPQVDFSVPEPTPKDTAKTKVTESVTTITGKIDNMTEDDIDLTEEDDIVLDFGESSDDSEENTEPSASAEDPTAPFSVEATEAPEASQPEKTEEAKVIVAPKSKSQVKLKPLFSLNDRFLYARELFDGNMKMFDSTLEFIEGIEEYSVIEDYFYSELEWDAENSHVAAFMNILRPHFRV